MKRTSARSVVIGVVGVALAVGAPSRPVLAAEWVPFVLPWDDASAGAVDLRPTLPRPAGAAGRVTVRDGRLYTGPHRLKLFGVNVTGGACFPDHATAEAVAARMAKFGLNAVRFHFLDSTWGEVRLVDYASGSWTNWSADAFDRLDYFVARLREQGIYVNLNLLVGRRFGVGDGVDPAINRLDWKAAHAVGFFHAPHLEAQKAYATRLLAHRNPHTGLTYAEDPALAVVEINNENGLVHTWMSGDFDALPAPFAADLHAQWNAWLAGRYTGTPALAAAWQVRDEALGAELLANADFARGAEGWSLEQHQGAAAEFAAKDGVGTLRVRAPGTESWHVQFNQPRLRIVRGQLYTVRFRAAADTARRINATLMQAHEPWESLGWSVGVDVTPEWQRFAYTFVAERDDDNARFGFSNLGVAGAAFRFADVSLKPGGRIGLEAGERLEARAIAVPARQGARALTDGARRDWIAFLWETEQRHWSAMYRHLRERCGVKAPIVGTIVATSTPNLMAALDLVDTHAYWQHPHFPGRPWDRNNWTVRNVTMVDAADGGTLPRLAWQRVQGKPHMVSEYNHPAPNLHAGEGPLLLAAYAALQDWDALFLYTYSHETSKTKADRIPDFFDIGQHPAIMANVPAASLLFRRGDVAPARGEVVLPFGAEAERANIAAHGHAWGIVNFDRLGVDLRTALLRRVALDVTGRAPSPAAALTAGAPDPAVWSADTGELTWRQVEKGRGLVELRAPRAKGLIGRADGRSVDLGGGVRVTVGRTDANWCTFSLVLLEGAAFDRRPGRALLVASGHAENTGMGWKNAEKSTVGEDWGRSPSLVESVRATVELPGGGAAPQVHALDVRGQRAGAVDVVATPGGGFRFETGPQHRTIWYEITLP